jgi:hypothetical protein
MFYTLDNKIDVYGVDRVKVRFTYLTINAIDGSIINRTMGY